MRPVYAVLRPLLVAFSLLVAQGSAHAATIVARSVEYLAQTSDLVVEAVVEARTYERDTTGQMWTRHTLAVRDYLKGKAPSTLDVLQLGGMAEDGRITKIEGDISLQAGDHVVLFLTEGPHGLHSTLLGWSAFHVDGKGALAPVRRNTTDLGLMALDGIGRLVPVTPDDIRPPATYGELASRVRAARGGAQ